jgi:hypothetical protein
LNVSEARRKTEDVVDEAKPPCGGGGKACGSKIDKVLRPESQPKVDLFS